MKLIPAASVLVTDDLDRVLLVQRGHEPQKGRWSLSGGRGEVGEDPGQTALREAREETGLKLKLLQEVVTAQMPGSGDTLYDIRCFSAEIVGGDLKAGDDAKDIRWVGRQQLSDYELTTGLTESLIQAGYLPDPHREAGAIAVQQALVHAGLPHQMRRYGVANSLTEAAARRHISAGELIKTLVVRASDTKFYLVLIPGDRELDWPSLRNVVRANRLSLPSAEDAHRVTGFPRGAITPFGTKTKLQIIADAGIPKGKVALGAGAPGWGLTVDSASMFDALGVEIAPISRAAQNGSLAP